MSLIHTGIYRKPERRWMIKRKIIFFVPDLTHPHIFRHTFCTNYANSGMDIKDLQYLMGHSDAGVTLNVYTHASYAHAAEQMTRITEFRKKSDLKKEGYEDDILTGEVAFG